MLHVPLLRNGTVYKSLDVERVPHYRWGQPFVEISQANPGLIRRDLLRQEAVREILAEIPCAELMEICKRAAEAFATASLPLGDSLQSPRDYVEGVSATTGLPYALVRKNMGKIRMVLEQVKTVLEGLTRKLDLRVLDDGFGEVDGQPLSFFPRAQSLGVVLPSNSPGVHTLWAPAVALKMPLVLKPGRAEPWTPYRIVQSLVQAGCPREVFSYYPTDHAGAAEILRGCGRSMLFGDVSTTERWAGNRRIEIHGPGCSKVVIGEDSIDAWEQYLDVIVASIVENSGRSCVNASGVWVPARGREIASALADRLARIVPRDAEDEEALLAPFPDPRVAARISKTIDQGLEKGGARDVTASRRGTPRLCSWQGCTYLLPTIVLCESAEHPLANREFLFPFASVVELKQSEMAEKIGPSLVVTAITSDSKFKAQLLASPLIGRLNLGAIPTNQVSWDQPHEGNLFEHLYARRALQRTYDTVPT